MVKRNQVLSVGAAVAAVMVGLVYAASVAKQSPRSDKGEKDAPVVVETSNASMATLGNLGDTPDETLRTLVANINKDQGEKAALEQELKRTQDALQTQKKESNAQLDALAQRLNQQLVQLEQKIGQDWETLKARQQPIAIASPDLDALGINSEREGDISGYEELGTSHASTSLVWIEPLDAKQDEEGQWTTPLMKAANALSEKASDMDAPFDSQSSITPVYTLHRGTILSNATSLTALMGRIPVNGQVTSPYPFSMVVGNQNLMANGFSLHDVQGAIVTGTVTGDWSLSCVRGVVESIDFIRTDGTILSYPQEEDAIDASFDGQSVQTQDLGYLADPNGNPCLTGVRISNAPQYLTTKGLLDAASAAAEAAASAQQTVTVEGGSSTSALTGSAMTHAAGQSAAALTGTISEFIQARMGSSFDIVYVEPGVKAAIHFRKPITLSVPAVPYRVRYDNSSQGGAYALP
ncbi:TIGR03752 family integrating conjugative element protein [Vibrio jasicida]|uniref:TIGR03752 family integrating conjugative element protein n=1 Tax=Vibrio jasicida TaxID=766224 RepID=UPI00069786E4|nr:TIGR03752 family integrating conjugative element protein [Vibrio jasicida]